MHKRDHLLITAALFGGQKVAERYAWVHDWLDELANRGVSLLKHRQYRHHGKALDTEFVLFMATRRPDADRTLARKIAEQHILDDMTLIPPDESWYV